MDLFAQSTYKHAVLSTTLNIYSRLSLGALGGPFGSWGVCWHLPNPVSSRGLIVRAKTPYRHPDRSLSPFGWRAFHPPAASYKPRAPQPQEAARRAGPIHSLQLLHVSLQFLSRKAGKQRQPFLALLLDTAAEHNVACSLHRLQDRAQSCSITSPEKGLLERQQDLSCRISKACSEVAPAQQTHSFCRPELNRPPCFSSGLN